MTGCSSPLFRAPVLNLTSTAKQKTLFRAFTTKTTPPVENLKHYKVKKGETLYGIAWKHGLDINALARINNLKFPYTIYAHQTLNLTETKATKRYQKKKAILKSSSTSQKNTHVVTSSQKKVNKSDDKVVLKKSKGYSVGKGNTKTVQKVVKAPEVKPVLGKVNNWRWPAKGKLIKTFSSSQIGLKGISIANQRGTPIYATAAGTVVYAGSGLQGYGNLIIIKHNYDYLSAYAHNEKLLVHENEQIKVGQKIAIMGDSGTDKVHLHFEIRYRGKSVDPLRYLTKR